MSFRRRHRGRINAVGFALHSEKLPGQCHSMAAPAGSFALPVAVIAASVKFHILRRIGGYVLLIDRSPGDLVRASINAATDCDRCERSGQKPSCCAVGGSTSGGAGHFPRCSKAYLETAPQIRNRERAATDRPNGQLDFRRGPSLLPYAIRRADGVMWLDPSEWVRAWRLAVRP
jgi:hypothetical protein